MQWWITDGPLPDGEKIRGPFEYFDTAREVRGRLEQETAPKTYWIDSER
jgi:hypothetical protein